MKSLVNCLKRTGHPGVNSADRKSSIIKLILKACAALIVLIALAFPPAMAYADNDQIATDSWTTLQQRRYNTLTLSDHGYGQRLFPKKLLHLTESQYVVTFEGSGQQNGKELYVMLEVCPLDGLNYYSDAVMLREDESASEFYRNNTKFIIPRQDNVMFARCMRQGVSFSTSQRTNQYIVAESEDRANKYLDLWTYFLYAYKKDLRRAAEFFDLSLARQTELITSHIVKEQYKALNNKLVFYDWINPLGALHRDRLPISFVDRAVLKEYLEVMVFARKKLQQNDPRHEKRLNIEYALLNQINHETGILLLLSGVIMNAGSLKSLQLLFMACLAAIHIYGCISISRTSTGDFYAADRIENAITKITAESDKAAQEIKKQSNPGQVNKALVDYANRHFRKADEIVRVHAIKQKESLPHVSFNDFIDKRKVVLTYTTRIEPALVIIPADYASATAFPHGEIIVTEPLIRPFNVYEQGYNDALLGIFIHELIHVRDGHSIEQWSTADGRKELISSKVYGTMADMTALIPFLSVNYDMQYGVSFKSAAYLRSLSEYAADLGVVDLMIENGFDEREYLSFLNDVSRYTDDSENRQVPPFSWLSSRCECLDIFTDLEAIGNQPKIVVGSKEDGDEIVQWIDSSSARELVQYGDVPYILRQLLSKSFNVDNFSDQELKALATLTVQKHVFTVCAIEQSFPNLRAKDGVLVTPSFDLSMFVQYF